MSMRSKSQRGTDFYNQTFIIIKSATYALILDKTIALSINLHFMETYKFERMERKIVAIPAFLGMHKIIHSN